MKLKYVLIIVGSMLLLIGLLSFVTPSTSIRPETSEKTRSIVISVIGLGTLLTGVFWKKQ